MLVAIKRHIPLLFIICTIIGAGVFYDKLYPFHLALIPFIFFNWIPELFQQKKALNYQLFFGIFIGYYLISVIGTTSPVLGIKYCVLLFFGFVIIESIKNVAQHNGLSYLLKWMSIIFGFEILVAVLEVGTHFRWPFSPYSSYLNYFGKSDLFTRQISLAENWSQRSIATGFRWNPNDLSTTLAILWPFTLLIKQRVIKIGLVTLFPLIVIANSSRAVILAMVMITVIYFVIQTDWKKWKNWLVIALVSSSLIVLFQIDNPIIKTYTSPISDASRAVYLMLNSNEKDGSSVSVRSELISDAFVTLKRTHFLGVGAGQSPNIQIEQKSFGNHVTSLHNFWMEILVEGGILIFLMVAMGYGYLTLKLYRIYSQKTDYSMIALCAFLSLIGFALAGISCSSVIYLFPMWILLGLSIAIIHLHESTSTSRPK